MTHPQARFPTRRRTALAISFGLCYIALASILLVALFLNRLLSWYAKQYTSNGSLYMSKPGMVLILLYLCLAVAAAVLICLLALLFHVRDGRIFTSVSCSLVTAIAWLVIAEGGLFALVGLAFPLSFGVAYVSVTIGLCLLVVRGILKDATQLKEENDQTI
jgi:membrane-anchored protein YejM (alkaline phosphatase superfamily)